jgi:hypothetical protein
MKMHECLPREKMRSANYSDGDLNKEAAQLNQDVGDIYCKREIQT